MKEARLFFDVFELAPASGSSIGIYKYAKRLFHALVSVPRPGLTVVVGCNGDAVQDFQLVNPAVSVEVMVVSRDRPGTLRRLGWTFFEASLRVRNAKCSMYFSPRGFLPYFLRSIGEAHASIVTIHDLIPLWYREHFPDYFGKLHQWFICSGLVRGALKSDLVITISDASALDIQRRTGRTALIRRIYNGMDESGSPAADVPRNYLLAMTSQLPHKNSDCILRAYKDYRRRSDRPLDLVICGLKGEHGPGITAVSGLSDEALRKLFQGARAFAFMSLTEGFGFPPLEAMECGTRTICSDIPVIREITQGAAIYIDPARSDLLADALLQLEANPDDPGQQAARRSVAGSYSWTRCANQLFDEIGLLHQRRLVS